MVDNKQQRNEPEPEKRAGMKEENEEIGSKDVAQATVEGAGAKEDEE